MTAIAPARDSLFTATEVLEAPTNVTAEWSVLSQLMGEPKRIGEVIGIPLERTDFSGPDTRLIYATVVERYYQSQPIDALIIGEMVRDELAQFWNADPMSVAGLLVKRAREASLNASLLEHAEIVRRLSTGRQLMETCYRTVAMVHEGKLSPEEVGDALSTQALQITAGTIRRTELLDWMDTGREFVKLLRQRKQAREEGAEIGVYTGFSFIDGFTAGIGPGELCFLAGEPGIGKTNVAWHAGLGFAGKQMGRTLQGSQKRVTTLFLSMEMNLYGSTSRIVSSLTGIDAVRLREGDISMDEMRHLLREWKYRENLPIVFNFASNFRLSQLRALIAEGIRKANVGFVIIDHFRMIDTDRRYQNPNDADEAKVRFLKENIAKDLDVAVMCLAHSTKVGQGVRGESPKPRLADLRGSGMIAAHADFVAFLWNPMKYMSDEAEKLMLPPGAMELLWEKNRWGQPGKALLKFEQNTMKVTAL